MESSPLESGRAGLVGDRDPRETPTLGILPCAQLPTDSVFIMSVTEKKMRLDLQ